MSANAHRDIRDRIAGAEQAVEKLTAIIEGYKRLPIVHGNLVEKIRLLAQALFFLQTNIYNKQNQVLEDRKKLIFEQELQRISDSVK